MNNSNSSETLEIDPIKFFFQNLSEYFPYTFLACFATITGIFGNLVIVGAILCTKELKTVSNMFVFNLSIADFFISTLRDFYKNAHIYTPALSTFFTLLKNVVFQAEKNATSRELDKNSNGKR